MCLAERIRQRRLGVDTYSHEFSTNARHRGLFVLAFTRQGLVCSPTSLALTVQLALNLPLSLQCCHYKHTPLFPDSSKLMTQEYRLNGFETAKHLSEAMYRLAYKKIYKSEKHSLVFPKKQSFYTQQKWELYTNC